MGQRGFTLVEILIAMAILTVGLVGVGLALGAQAGGVVNGLGAGQTAVTRGHYISTATFLAQARLEQLKQLDYAVGGTPIDQFGAGAIPPGFADEAFGAIAGLPNFSRQVRMQDGVPAANMKLLTVTVSYRLPKEAGMETSSIVVSTIVTARPTP